MTTTDTIFQRQNIYLKLIYVLVSIAVALCTELKTITVLLMINLILYIPDTRIHRAFVMTLYKLYYFWSFYLLCGIIFHLDYQSQMIFLFRLILMLQISVFMLRSVTKNYLLNDTKSLCKYPAFVNIVYFFLYLFEIQKKIIIKYQQATLDKVPAHERFSKGYLDRIISMLKNLFEDIEMRDIRELSIDHDFEPKSFYPNIYLVIMILVIVGICI